MKLPAFIERVIHREDVNFFITNQIPRRLATHVVGWISRLEAPVLRDMFIAVFTLFAGDLRLHEAKKTRFSSLHDCFVRELREGVRPVDPDPSVVVSPCDGIVGAFGTINKTELLQAKGSAYTLEDLLGDPGAVARYQGGSYVTLRLTANMYHRFHAPADCRLDGATYISGDTWNVNPIALKRIARLYCKNERVAIHARIGDAEEPIALVAVAAVLVASVHLSFLGQPLTLAYQGPNQIACTARYGKGEELGYFHHGSTIIVLAGRGLSICSHIRTGDVMRVGERLLLSAPASIDS
jgi:phosphatidylserine decarboxylase